MILTQTTLMNMEPLMNFKVQLVLVTEICLYLLLLNSHFFWKQPSGGGVGGGHSGGVCSESAGEMPVPGCDLNKIAK